ncbi:MAG: beta-lactamase family protein [Actinobacteria bacterium]|nr:beta-lactamase family protein [Actinomycetota bacterium]
MNSDCVAEMQRLADATATNDHCPSISWGVVAAGTLAHHGSAGTVNDEPPKLDTVYRIASMTKSFTAATALALRDQGVWSLDDSVAVYAPELRDVKGPPSSPPLTLRHLLSMASGLATDDAWADRHLDITPEEIDAIYAGGPSFAHLPGAAYEYSNLGYAMIGRAIERATGRRAQQHITEMFLTPLGLADTTWTQPTHDNWARPYRVQDGEIIPDTPAPLGDGELAPMGGLWSTVSDLAKWVAWFDSATSHPDHAPTIGLSAASRREMQRIHTYIGINTVAERTSPAGYGLGLNVRHDPTLGTIVSHAGGLPGYGSNMRWFAGRGVGVIALSNTFYAPMSALTMRLLAALHTHGAVPAPPAIAAAGWASAAHQLVDLLNNWEDAVAAELFADNVVLDESFDRRRVDAQKLVTAHGTLRVIALRASSATSGEFDVRGSGEKFRITMEQSPLPGAQIQSFDVHD